MSPDQNPAKPKPQPEKNEASNIRPSSKPTPDELPAPGAAKSNEEEENVPEPSKDIEHVGE